MSRHLKRMRRIYAARRQTFRDKCEAHLAGKLTLLAGEAGIQVVGLLHEGLDDRRVAEEALRLGVNVSPLSKHFRHGHPIQGLVLGYAACDENQMEQGILRLKRAIERASA